MIRYSLCFMKSSFCTRHNNRDVRFFIGFSLVSQVSSGFSIFSEVFHRFLSSFFWFFRFLTGFSMQSPNMVKVKVEPQIFHCSF